MVEKDVEMFLEACELKGLSMKTIGSYEQTLRLFMQHLYKIGIERTENVTHLTIQGYIQEIRRRGKYTAVTNQDARNYPENRPDYGKQVSDVTINNYLRNLRVFFNWCVDEDMFNLIIWILIVVILVRLAKLIGAKTNEVKSRTKKKH